MLIVILFWVYDMIWMIEEFNVDWKAECGQLNPAHVTRNKKIYKKMKLKQ